MVARSAGAASRAVGGHTSGYTSEKQEGRYYRVTFTTPCIAFATDPTTGESGEREYHDRAGREFRSLLEKVKPSIERSVAALRSELEGGPTLLPFDDELPEVWDYELGRQKSAVPCRMSFRIDYPEHGSLELSFARAPTREQSDTIQGRVRELFSDVNMGPSQKGKYHRITLSVRADFSMDPATGKIVTPELDRMRPLIEKSVAALLAEFGGELSLSPFSDADALLRDPQVCGERKEGGPFRMGIKVYCRDDAFMLYLSFGKAPTQARFVAISTRANQFFSVEDVVDDSRWSVRGRPALWLFHRKPQLWVFHFDGVVEAVGRWKGGWTRTGGLFTVSLDEKTVFVVEFTSDGRTFTARAGSRIEYTGTRVGGRAGVTSQDRERRCARIAPGPPRGEGPASAGPARLSPHEDAP
jgi:hypothetical protein